MSITKNINQRGKDVVSNSSFKKCYVYFALITNEKMDAFTTLHLYRMKDIVEKGFCNIKEKLNMRRLLSKSEKNLDGKIFNEFIALILIFCLDHKMKETDLYKSYTMQQLLDKLDVLECYEDENRTLGSDPFTDISAAMLIAFLHSNPLSLQG